MPAGPVRDAAAPGLPSPQTPRRCWADWSPTRKNPTPLELAPLRANCAAGSDSARQPSATTGEPGTLAQLVAVLLGELALPGSKWLGALATYAAPSTSASSSTPAPWLRKMKTLVFVCSPARLRPSGVRRGTAYVACLLLLALAGYGQDSDETAPAKAKKNADVAAATRTIRSYLVGGAWALVARASHHRDAWQKAAEEKLAAFPAQMERSSPELDGALDVSFTRGCVVSVDGVLRRHDQ